MITSEQLNSLSAQAFKISEAHGFNMGPEKRKWWTAIAACEVAEVVNAYRTGKRATSPKLELMASNPRVYNEYAKDTIQDEMADIAIYCLSIAGSMKTDFREVMPYVSEDTSTYFIHDDFISTAIDVMGILLHEATQPFEDDYKSSLRDIISIVEAWMKEETGDDLLPWIEAKMNYNRTRPYLHGRYADRNSTKEPGKTE